MEKISVEPQSYKRLLNHLKITTGLNFQFYRDNFIEKRVKARMIRVNCATIKAYHDYILAHSDESKKFFDGFNINYSYFFRNYDVFEKFQDLFIKCLYYNNISSNCDLIPHRPINHLNIKTPEKLGETTIIRKDNNWSDIVKENYQNATQFFKIYFDQNKISEDSLLHPQEIDINLKETSLYKKFGSPKRPNNQILIWSCPCASGEEPYSIAMILNNLKNQIPNFPDYKIVASDIDENAIENAKLGVYNDYSMNEIPSYFNTLYFKKKKEFFREQSIISDSIKKEIEFIAEDVTKVHKKNWKYDVIFCRYLLIYISRELRDQFLNIIDNHLAENGLLILGKTETLFNSHLSFRLVDSKNHIYIKKSALK